MKLLSRSQVELRNEDSFNTEYYPRMKSGLMDNVFVTSAVINE